MTEQSSYLMENREEILRLELKTEEESLRRQAAWCGVSPGLRVLDAGCGPGKTTAILQRMLQPGGSILGLDYSRERVEHAQAHYGGLAGVSFDVHDLRTPLEGFGTFDLIWTRFVLEYNRKESPRIIRNLAAALDPGGWLCLLDLDYNCLSHYPMPRPLERMLFSLASLMEQEFNFDPYVGRKMYTYLYDAGLADLQVDMLPHHLIYGDAKAVDVFNWLKKAEITSGKAGALFEGYPGGKDAFFQDFKSFFHDPRRFTYTPLILCKGRRPRNPLTT